jgi:PAS domain S-box-containing protein
MSIVLRDEAFRSIFDAVHDGIFISDPATGMFIEVNAPACKMFGYQRADLIGRDIAALSSGVAPYTHEGALENVKKAMTGTGQVFEWHCKIKDGSLFWAEISICYTEIDQMHAIVAIVRDITERKRLSENLKAALFAASEASKAESAFLATMSHELRTPLNAIIGFSDLMSTEQLGPLGNPRYREYVGDIHKSGLQLLSLIDDLLDLSQIDAGKAKLVEQSVSLRHVITEAVRMVALQAKQMHVKVVTELPSDLPFVYGDERRIMQIILNLLSNAIKFTHADGTVSILVEQWAGELLLKVSDTGIGIAAKDLPKVLERFGQVDSTLSRKHKGTGLGLPLVKDLIGLHGGSISIESKVDIGTVVTVCFPPERVINTINNVAA